MEDIQEFATLYSLPPAVTQRMVKYYDTAKFRFLKLDRIFSVMTWSVRGDMLMSQNAEMVKACKLFKSCNNALIKSISYHLKPEVFPVGDRIIRKDEVGLEMYFLVSGIVSIYAKNDKDIQCTISDGNFFGEGACMQTSEARKPQQLDLRLCSVEAASWCEMRVLHRSSVVQITADFPEFGELLRTIRLARKVITDTDEARRLSLSCACPCHKPSVDTGSAPGGAAAHAEALRVEDASPEPVLATPELPSTPNGNPNATGPISAKTPGALLPSASPATAPALSFASPKRPAPKGKWTPSSTPAASPGSILNRCPACGCPMTDPAALEAVKGLPPSFSPKKRISGVSNAAAPPTPGTPEAAKGNKGNELFGMSPRRKSIGRKSWTRKSRRSSVDGEEEVKYATHALAQSEKGDTFVRDRGENDDHDGDDEYDSDSAAGGSPHVGDDDGERDRVLSYHSHGSWAKRPSIPGGDEIAETLKELTGGEILEGDDVSACQTPLLGDLVVPLNVDDVMREVMEECTPGLRVVKSRRSSVAQSPGSSMPPSGTQSAVLPPGFSPPVVTSSAVASKLSEKYHDVRANAGSVVGGKSMPSSQANSAGISRRTSLDSLLESSRGEAGTGEVAQVGEEAVGKAGPRDEGLAEGLARG
eukprot:Rmarinus@m.8472